MSHIPDNQAHNADSPDSETQHVPVTEAGGSRRSGNLIIAIIALLVIITIFSMRGKEPADDAAQNANLQSGTSDETGLSMNGTAPTAVTTLPVQQSWLQNFADIIYTHVAQLHDVSESGAQGTAGADVIDGAYHLYATFTDLPPAASGYFYEGWVVRTDPVSVISTGKLTEHVGAPVNAFLTRTDLLDHDRYILTLEPDDNDPAPAEHILEGKFSVGK